MNKCQLFDFWKPLVKCIYNQTKKRQIINNVLMNYPTLEKTLKSHFHCIKMTKKEKPILVKERCKKEKF
jgi:hypothetical protein